MMLGVAALLPALLVLVEVGMAAGILARIWAGAASGHCQGLAYSKQTWKYLWFGFLCVLWIARI